MFFILLIINWRLSSENIIVSNRDRRETSRSGDELFDIETSFVLRKQNIDHSSYRVFWDNVIESIDNEKSSRLTEGKKNNELFSDRLFLEGRRPLVKALIKNDACSFLFSALRASAEDKGLGQDVSLQIHHILAIIGHHGSTWLFHLSLINKFSS